VVEPWGTAAEAAAGEGTVVRVMIGKIAAGGMTAVEAVARVAERRSQRTMV